MRMYINISATGFDKIEAQESFINVLYNFSEYLYYIENFLSHNYAKFLL